jgi:uncharacterized coiled-coil protein SlyX
MKAFNPNPEDTKMKAHHTETRLSLLEQSINNINDTLMRFEKRFDKMDDKIEKLNREIKEEIKFLDTKFESRFDKFDSRMWQTFVWTMSGFGATIAGFVTILGVMAHGFKWF